MEENEFNGKLIDLKVYKADMHNFYRPAYQGTELEVCSQSFVDYLGEREYY